MKPLLVGEDNPYSADPRFALWPDPDRSAGARLCREILGLQRMEYFRRFDRVNLCAGKWHAREARDTALKIEQARAGVHSASVVLCGRKVAGAFGYLDTPPFSRRVAPGGFFVYVIPHPSGLSRAWNEPGAYERARVLLAPLLVLKCEHPATYRMMDHECPACAERRSKQKNICPHCDGDHRDCSSS